MRLTRALFLIAGLLLLAGCSGFARGVTEAVLENNKKDAKPRECYIKGSAFGGMEQAFDRDGTLKLLVVHGIGEHTVGYSTRLVDNLIKAMGLEVMDETIPTIPIYDPRIGKQQLGILKVNHYMNREQSHHLIVYELTWSLYIEDKKKFLDFDEVSESAAMRANINAGLKEFFNSRVPDPMIYLSKEGEGILAAVTQSFCWMAQPDWRAIGKTKYGHCNIGQMKSLDALERDQFYFVTYSLGSHIVVRGMDRVQQALANFKDAHHRRIASILQNKTYTIYMLANQLPLIQLGTETAKIHGQKEDYCTPQGKHYRQRWMNTLSIAAFSDPNDLLSYTIPEGFENRYMDSRLCPAVTNAIVKVADEISLFSLGSFASPQAAHSDYDIDERVINLMTKGAQRNASGTASIPDSCRWVEIVKGK